MTEQTIRSLWETKSKRAVKSFLRCGKIVMTIVEVLRELEVEVYEICFGNFEVAHLTLVISA